MSCSFSPVILRAEHDLNNLSEFWGPPQLQQIEIFHKIGKRSLRELAREYNVSYETVRRIIKRD
jgi:hypothetical protein